MKNILTFTVFASILTSLGCGILPYHEKVLVDIQTSEVAIMVETVNDNGQAAIAPKNKGSKDTGSDFYKNRLVNARKVEIPYYLKQTGRARFYKDFTNTAWKPAARLIVVNTAPTSVQWDNDDKNMAIWVESSDSVGFSTGISVTARIENQEDAITFLSNYPPESYREIQTQTEPFRVEVTSLNQIINEELRSEIQDTYSYVSAGFVMDDLRDKKQYIIDIVKHGGTIRIVDPGKTNKNGEKVYKEVSIEGVIPVFKERGVTITSLGQFGGFRYENPNIQEAIDNVFKAQQDEEVAKAEAKAAEQRKVALRLKGEGDAARILESKRGEAEGIKLVADAKAYEIQKLQENPEAYLSLIKLEISREQMRKWNGTLPKMVMGGETSFLMNVPNENK